jgi:hypothetical protein
MEKFEDLLPKLGQIIAEDFRDPQTELSEVFEDYVFLFDVIYKALSLPDEGQREVAGAVEEFIQLRQDGEWNTPKGLVYRIRDIVQRYERFQELMVQLAQKMLEDFSCQHHTYRSFYNTFSDYAYIMGCVEEVFPYQDKEAISKAFQVLEEFLQGKKGTWKLKDELEEIVSKFCEEVSHEKQKT